MDEVVFDPNTVIYILITSYMFLLRSMRNQTRPILLDVMRTERQTMDTIPSTNSIISAILNYDDAVTRMHLRISSNTFIEIACGASYRIVGAATDIPRSTICDVVHKLLDFTAENITPKVIMIPNEDELPRIGRKFNRRARTTIFGNAAGAIDRMHVEIMCPVQLHDQYINRKLRYSIQSQAICDSSFKFVDVFIEYPGSVHDSRVLYCSPVFKEKLYPPPVGRFWFSYRNRK